MILFAMTLLVASAAALDCPINVMLAIDASSSMSRSDFAAELTFGEALVDAIGVRAGGAALGALQFAARIALITPLVYVLY